MVANDARLYRGWNQPENRKTAICRTLAMTSAACMTTARPFGMTVGTGITAVVLTGFFNSFAGIDNTQARLTSTFHLSNRRHGNLLNQ